MKYAIECPYCKEIIVTCDFAGCENISEYRGWYGSGLIRKINACAQHAKELNGYDKYVEEHGEITDSPITGILKG